MFYLPFEHGGQALQILQEFNWLKSNAHVVITANRQQELAANQTGDIPVEASLKSPEIQEWFARAEKLSDLSLAVNRLFDRLTYCNNRELLYDLYAYVWDMRGVISLLNSYVKWLGLLNFCSKTYFLRSWHA